MLISYPGHWCLHDVFLIQGTEDTELTLTREGDFIGSTDDNVEEINIFDGKFNRITFEQVYTKTFKCTYQLQLYPFDRQVNIVTTLTIVTKVAIHTAAGF